MYSPAWDSLAAFSSSHLCLLDQTWTRISSLPAISFDL